MKPLKSQLISNLSGAPAELPFVIKSRLSQKSPIPQVYWGVIFPCFFFFNFFSSSFFLLSLLFFSTSPEKWINSGNTIRIPIGSRDLWVGSRVATPKHIDMFVNRVIFSSFLTVCTTNIYALSQGEAPRGRRPGRL